MSTRVGSQDTPPNLGVLGGNGAHLPVPAPWVKVAFGGSLFPAPQSKAGRVGAQGAPDPPSLAGGAACGRVWG